MKGSGLLALASLSYGEGLISAGVSYGRWSTESILPW